MVTVDRHAVLFGSLGAGKARDAQVSPAFKATFKPRGGTAVGEQGPSACRIKGS